MLMRKFYRFSKISCRGVKDLDYLDICKIAELIKNKAHLTISGMEEIKKIKAGMNRNRNE